MSKYKDLDWNAAYFGQEDNNALNDSEIFRNFAAIELKKEAKRIEEEQKSISKFENIDDVFNFVRTATEPSIISHFDYDSLEPDDNLGLEEEEMLENDATEEEEITAEALEVFEMQIKEANLKEAEMELGLDSNYYFNITRGKDA